MQLNALDIDISNEKTPGMSSKRVVGRGTPRVFFVVGAAKAGTTSLFHYLKQHPQLYLHPYKDVACHFCTSYGMPLTNDEFMSLMTPSAGNQLAAGDVCSDYLADPGAAAAIFRTCPNAKIIIVLRNPADRAFSLYQWMIKEGFEFLPTFEEALAAEQRRMMRGLKGPELISPSKQAYLYFHSGLYSGQVRRFLELFGREQVFIARYDDLVQDSARLMRRLYAFLDVDPDFTPKTLVHNRGRSPRWTVFSYFCRRRLARVLPHRIVIRLIKANALITAERRLSPELRERLLSRYAEDIRDTQVLTGLDLQSWLGSTAS